MVKKPQKIVVITAVCSLIVLVFTLWSLIRSHRPSRGKPYERISAAEAYEYMSYEADYCIVDVRDRADYELGHVPRACSLPYDRIVEEADDVIGDRGRMVYVYAQTSEYSCAAAQKLSDIGFTSITETGTYTDWLQVETETEPVISLP